MDRIIGPGTNLKPNSFERTHMSETATPSVWEDLIHSQRWEDLRARLTATHSSDIAEAMGQIHRKEQAVVFRLLSRDQAAEGSPIYPPSDRKSCSAHSPRMKSRVSWMECLLTTSPVVRIRQYGSQVRQPTFRSALEGGASPPEFANRWRRQRIGRFTIDRFE